MWRKIFRMSKLSGGGRGGMSGRQEGGFKFILFFLNVKLLIELKRKVWTIYLKKISDECSLVLFEVKRYLHGLDR